MSGPAESSILIGPGGAFAQYREKGQSRSNTPGVAAPSLKQGNRVVLMDAPEVYTKLQQQQAGKLKSPEIAKTRQDQGERPSPTTTSNRLYHQGQVCHSNDRLVSLLPSSQQMIVSPIQKPTLELESTAGEMSHLYATTTTNSSHLHHRHCIPALGSKESTEQKDSSSGSSLPPVAEIRIPTPQTHVAKTDDEVSCEVEEADQDNNDDDDDDADADADADRDYKTLFLCCQHSLHKAQRHVGQVIEENRLLKRQLIQLHKQLNTYRRNKHPSSWTIPVNARLKKRLRTEEGA